MEQRIKTFLLFLLVALATAGCKTQPSKAPRFLFIQIRPMTAESRQAIDNATTEMNAVSRRIVFEPTRTP